MKCPKCQFNNPKSIKFCGECGSKLEKICPECNYSNQPNFKFCGECGFDFRKQKETPSIDYSGSELHPSIHKQLEEHLSLNGETPAAYSEIESERKYVTILFSDLSGYTTMCERLDPEEVKEIMSLIFGKIAEIIQSYDGFIERFIGDSVMAIFGVPKAHEDDPIRAIRAAMGIHAAVESFSPRFEGKIGRSLTMHTGINTGLVVTGEVDVEKGTHGLTGDAINLASRLEGIAKSGEIVVGPATYSQAVNYFEFETLELTKVKGKQKPVNIYKVQSVKKESFKTHRLHGLRAELIGRKVEMAELAEAIENLYHGQGSVISIFGTAGTGKSRLVEEFKTSLDWDQIQWLEGHGFHYTQNIPYAPLIDLMNQAIGIEEGDPSDQLKEKIEKSLTNLIGQETDIIPYIGSLYSLDYPEIKKVTSEYWKSQLFKAIQMILNALAQRGPTVICLEDLHWADPSSLELVLHLLSYTQYPLLLLCVYRPTITLLSGHQIKSLGKTFREIRLQDLSPSDSQDMVESILQTRQLPSELKRFVQDKIEGNPFYIEEVVNSLIESEILIREEGQWKVTRTITESEISSSIHGVIASRLDRLGADTKRLLQEASVIGRSFFYEILQKITEISKNIDRYLSILEQLDLVKTKSFQPELEYIFKHALTQEVVYNGLLKKERRLIHEKIGVVMEILFHDRLGEHYEALAFHFKNSWVWEKAVEYLIKSGQKCLRRYSVTESHQHFSEAFTILNEVSDKSEKWKNLIVELLIKWGPVHYYSGDFRKFIQLFKDYQEIAESLNNKTLLARYYTWFGIAYWNDGKTNNAYEYLHQGLEIGEDINDPISIGYACTFLAFACAELCLFEEGFAAGNRAQEIAIQLPADQFLYFKSLAGLCYIYWWKGDLKKLLTGADTLIQYGQKHMNIRSLVMGHYFLSFYYFSAGDIPSLLEISSKAAKIAADPYYSQFPKLWSGAGYLLSGNVEEAETILQELISYDENHGIGVFAGPAYIYLGATKIAKGEMGCGMELILKGQKLAIKNKNNSLHVNSELILGHIFLQIQQGQGVRNILTLARNIGFIVKNVPFAFSKAETHLTNAIDEGTKYGLYGIVSRAHYFLTFLYQSKKRIDLAKQHLEKAINLFERNGAHVYLKEAKEMMNMLQ